MNIYLLVGTTGEYSYRTYWYVKAFTTEELAKNYAKLCNDEVASLEKMYVGDYHEIRGKAHVYDPQFQYDYTGTGYFVKEVELVTNK